MAEAVSVTAQSVDMLAEFHAKGDLLGREYPQVTSEDYYRTIFRDGYEARRVAGWTRSGGPKGKQKRKGKCIRRFAGCTDMVEQSQKRSDAYTFLMDFYNDYPKTELLKKVYGLVVDLDGCSVADVGRLLQSDFIQLRPTYVVNSGHGLHLVYAFEQPLDAYHWAVYELGIVYQRLKEHFVVDGMDYHVDNVGLVHMFRIIGSRTKLGCTCKAYGGGHLWPVEELAKRLGYSWADRRTQRCGRRQSKTGQHAMWKSNGCAAFYAKTKARIIAETPVGKRYMSMMALVTVGYKCHVSTEAVERDLRYLQGIFNERRNGHAVRDAEIAKAMTAYNEKAMTVKRETLNTWLGFAFEPCKRNGRSRAEHLARNRQAIHDTKIAIIRAYLIDHPEASSSEIADHTTVNRRTVMRYRAEVAEALAREAAAKQKAQEAQEAQAMQEKEPEQLPVTTSADINRLAMRICSTRDPVKRERLIACLSVSHQQIIRSWFSSA